MQNWPNTNNRHSPEELCWGCGSLGELQLPVTLVAWICGRRFDCEMRNRTRVRRSDCFRARQPNLRRSSVDNAREGKRTIARKHGHLRVLLLSASESERGFGSVFHHQLKYQPILRLVFFCLLPRVHGGWRGFLRTSPKVLAAVFGPVFSLRWPVLSVPAPTKIGQVLKRKI